MSRQEVIDGEFSIKYGDELDLAVGKYDKDLIRSNWIQLKHQSCEYFTITRRSKNPTRYTPYINIAVKCEEPRQVTKLLLKTRDSQIPRCVDSSELLSIANEMNSDEVMG
eukprot:896079_1